jgi:hypothetical protein
VSCALPIIVLGDDLPTQHAADAKAGRVDVARRSQLRRCRLTSGAANGSSPDLNRIEPAFARHGGWAPRSMDIDSSIS